MRRDDICLYLSPASRSALDAIIKNRNSSSKAVWRAGIVLATADGYGTNEIMRRTGKSKPTLCRWQERYIEEGIDGLLRDKTRPSRIPPLSDEIRLAVLTMTASETPANATHWSRASMAQAADISPSSVGRIWRGTFRSVAELEAAIDDYLLRHNATAKPYVRTKNASDILAR